MQEITLLRECFLYNGVLIPGISIFCVMFAMVYSSTQQAGFKKGLLKRWRLVKASFWVFFAVYVYISIVFLPTFTQMLFDLRGYCSNEFESFSGYAISSKNIMHGRIQQVDDFQYYDQEGKIIQMGMVYSAHMDEGDYMEGVYYPHLKYGAVMEKLPQEYRDMKTQKELLTGKSRIIVIGVIYVLGFLYAGVFIMNGLTVWSKNSNVIRMDYRQIRRFVIPAGILTPLFLACVFRTIEISSITWGYISIYLFWIIYLLSIIAFTESLFRVKLDEKSERITVCWGIPLWSEKKKEHILFKNIDVIEVNKDEKERYVIKIKYFKQELILMDPFEERVLHFKKIIDAARQ